MIYLIEHLSSYRAKFLSTSKTEVAYELGTTTVKSKQSRLAE